MPPTGEKLMGRKKTASSDQEAVRIDGDVVRMARTIASVSDSDTISRLVSETCRPVFRKKLEDMIKKGVFLPPEKS